ncbi:hydrophobin-3 precursor [Pisolithus orientalis]|uniref:hydrophobin-3 precursor n=1 Tax=Pisolithus orientalis TaxID=936130 RepID=UPI002224F8D2|nr:hydrophobin-3 precursor [Pisolithus orientalis]KAI5994894.1 hydrophobin-3 precursor [Pisolithus orientalis]
MFSRVFAIASLAALAVAGPLVARDSSQCNTGPIQCCQQVQQASDFDSIFQELGIANVFAGITGQIGTSCTPITVVGTGSGAQCNAQTVCCSGNQWGGLVNVGCMPINVNA